MDEKQELEFLRGRVEQLEQQVNRTEGPERLLSIFDWMFEGIQIIDDQFRYLYVNEAAAQHGYTTKENLIGSLMSDAFPGIEDSEMFARLRECMTSREPFHLTNEFRYQDGTQRWFDLRFTPIPAGVLILSIDITELRQSAHDAQQRENDLATILECMTEGIIATDLEGRVTRVNSAATLLTGWSADEIEGHSVDEFVSLIDGKTSDRLEIPIRRLTSQEMNLGISDAVLLISRDGRRIPVSYKSAPLRSNGDPIRGAVIAISDLTEEARLNEMLQKSQRMEAIGSLSGGIAHDFNNYLSVISGLAQLIAEDTTDDGIREDATDILHSAKKAAGLTSQLLAFSRQKVLQPEVINLNEAVARTRRMLQTLIGADIEFHLRLADDLGAINFDPVQIEQIIINLVVNARDAMPRGGRLTIETHNEYLDADYVQSHAGSQEGPHIMLRVSDTGEGIPPEVKNLVFEPFFTTKPLHRGTGLGLSTVYGIVKQSGGNIWLYSEVGMGTTFKIYLPESHSTAKIRSAAKQPMLKSTSATILVVEDDASLRKLIARLLKGSGYRTITAESPSEAIDACTRDVDIALMLTDIVMPGMDGLELEGRVRELAPSVKVVFMSGYTSDAMADRGLLNDGHDFLEKPITKEVLLAKISEVLGHPKK